MQELVAYRLIDPGSESRLHREWYLRSALADLFGEDFALAQKDKLYRCLDRLTEHLEALFDHLRRQWGELFETQFDVLLCDLTSTYFESDPPASEAPSKRRFGYSRDHRADCTQVVLALVVTPDGLPVAYEIHPDNTHEASTLEQFLDRVESRWGRARRTWLMDRGIPTEHTLAEMRSRGVDYLVGTPKGRLTKLEQELLERPWVQARETVAVKLLEQEDEFYVYVESQARGVKERSMRRRRLKRLRAQLGALRARKPLTRDQLLLSLGAAKKEAGHFWGLVKIGWPAVGKTVNVSTFGYELDRDKLRQVRRRKGRYLLRSNMRAVSPELVWENYLLLARIEQACKDLKGDLAVRPIYHQTDARIEAHIFVSFLAYCLHATLWNLACRPAGGLTVRAILEKLAGIAMIDVPLPTTDGREIVLRPLYRAGSGCGLLLSRVGLRLPGPSPPKVQAHANARL